MPYEESDKAHFINSAHPIQQDPSHPNHGIYTSREAPGHDSVQLVHITPISLYDLWYL